MGKILLLLCLCFPFFSYAQSPAFDQALLVGTTANSGSTIGNDVAVDAAGNTYLSGYFAGSMRLGNFTVSSRGSFDVFVAKRDPAGNYLWVTTGGGNLAELSSYVAVDASGNVYVTTWAESLSVKFGLLTANTTGACMVVVKLDAAGQVQWIANGGQGFSYNNTTTADDIAVDPAGNVYVVGSYTGFTNIGGTSMASGGSGPDIFVAKLSTAGNWLWAIDGALSDYVIGQGITVDANGSPYITGTVNGIVKLGNNTVGGSGSHMFVAKVNPAGSFVWAVGAYDSPDYAGGIALDGTGNIYVTGHFSGTSRFGTTTLVSAGEFDVFVAKLNSAGIYQWARRGGGLNYDYGDAITVSGSSVFVTGRYLAAATFGPSVLTHNVINTGGNNRDVYVCQVSTAGTILGAAGGGGTHDDEVFGIAADGQQGAYITGYFFSPSVTFGSTTLPGTAIGNKGYLAHFQGSPTPTAITPSVQTNLVNVWPNPVNQGRVWVSGVQAGQNIQLLDAQGQTICNKVSENAAQGMELSLLNLRPGMYFVRIGTQATKLVLE